MGIRLCIVPFPWIGLCVVPSLWVRMHDWPRLHPHHHSPPQSHPQPKGSTPHRSSIPMLVPFSGMVYGVILLHLPLLLSAIQLRPSPFRRRNFGPPSHPSLQLPPTHHRRRLRHWQPYPYTSLAPLVAPEAALFLLGWLFWVRMVGGWAGCPFRQHVLSPPQPVHSTSPCSHRCHLQARNQRDRSSRPHLPQSRHIWRIPPPLACPCHCCPLPSPFAISPSPLANPASALRHLP